MLIEIAVHKYNPSNFNDFPIQDIQKFIPAENNSYMNTTDNQHAILL